ncbi:MAG: hypothetical protein ACUVX1_12865 [Chloroflexota bacterium]
MPTEQDKEQPEPEETQGQPENPPAPPESNTSPTPDQIDAIKAELEEERKARAEADTALAQKDARIAELEASLSEAKKASEATTTELSQLKQAHEQAVAKYLDAVRLANPTIPAEVIAGTTIAEIDASVDKAKAIADSVKKTLEAQAKEAKVPAGAPARGQISLEGLSPREKIAAGLTQKGGT